MQPLQSTWQVAQQTKGKKWRPLGHALQEFETKLVKAAQKLQQQLVDSVEQPAVSKLAEDVADIPDIDEDSALADLKARQTRFPSESSQAKGSKRKFPSERS